MTGAQRDLEWIIREVVRRLEASTAPAGPRSDRGLPGPSGRPATDESVPNAPNTPDSTTTGKTAGKAEAAGAYNGRLSIGQRVVTLASLDGRLSGVRELVVPCAAVVTPAVRDLLRKRQIRLTFTAEPVGGTGGAAGSMLVALAAGPYDAEAAWKAVAAEASEAVRIDGESWVELAGRLTHAIAAEGRFGVLMTHRAMAAVCLANRQQAVRAVLATSAAAVGDAAVQVGANLLVIDPAAHGLYELRGMIRQFAHASHTCPEALRSVLEP